MTYKAVGRWIINHGAPVWSPTYTERGSEDRHWLSQDVLYRSPTHKAEMLKVREHSELLSAEYMARCMGSRNICHPITTRATLERQMKQTLYTRHRNTVEPMMVKNDRKATHSTLMQLIKLLRVTRGM